MISYRTIALAGVLAMGTTAASASSVTLSYDGATAGTPFTSVNILQAPSGVTSGPDTLAGAFNFSELDADNNVLRSFVAWCMDLSENLNQGIRNYHQSSSFITGVSELLGAGDRVQRLFDAVYHEVNPTNKVQSTAFQLALWEVIYDDNFDLSSNGNGVFRATADSDVLSAAEGWLSTASSWSGPQRWSLTFYDASNPSQQNIGTASAIPLPAAGWLLLGGLAALGAAARRRKSAA